MDIQWKQQHHNDACACLAMLLSGYAVDVQDDEIITESKMPYRVRFEPGDGGYFVAGLGDQSPEVYNSMLQRHRMMMACQKASGWTEFAKAADERLARKEAFMIHLPFRALPCPAYERFRQGAGAGPRHAVVLYASDESSYQAFDPWGGLDREGYYRFDEVRPKVDLRVEKPVLRREMDLDGGPWEIRYLVPWDGKQAMSILDLLNRTREALDAFVLTAARFGEEVAGSPAERHEKTLYDYLGRCFKPIALDWRSAIEAQQGRGRAQFDLIEKLYNLQELIMKQQKELDQRPGIGREFCADLSKLALAVQQASKAHLSSAYSIR